MFLYVRSTGYTAHTTKKYAGFMTGIIHKIILYNSFKVPSVLTVTTCHGMNLPLA